MPRVTISRILLYLGMGVFLFVCLAPFGWVFLASLNPFGDILRGNIHFAPARLTIANYRPLLSPQPGIRHFYMFMGNGFIVSLITAIISSIMALFGAYGLSRYRFPGNNTLSRMLLFIYTFPVILIAIPIYSIEAHLHLIDTLFGLSLIHILLAVPFCTWLLRSFIDSIPRALEEAAAVDGAGQLGALLHIILPLASPGIATVAIYSFVSSWGEYTFASVLITSNASKTLPLGLAMYASDQYIEWGQLLAGTVLTFLPLLLIFMPVSKLFIRGFTEGALK